MNIFTSVNIRDCRLIDDLLHCRLNVKSSGGKLNGSHHYTIVYVCLFVQFLVGYYLLYVYRMQNGKNSHKENKLIK